MHRLRYHVHEPECRLRDLRVEHGLPVPKEFHKVRYRHTSKSMLRAMLKSGVLQYRLDDAGVHTISVAEAIEGTSWQRVVSDSNAPAHVSVFAFLEKKFVKFGIRFRLRGKTATRGPNNIVDCVNGPLLIGGRQATLLDALMLPSSAFTTPRRAAAPAR
ncbi:MAG: hypothetical protein A2848_00125 [Candidatus Magasanikbacteria bacterium RIFCSPHIGHO2_01_FULL_50_8]|uniref:Uncharacterized protein n=2 Tax=Candidatus Magasanikiibacteriota TaxID=1752731 RepID=A0A1F6LSH1_9BACT|nr:MAG: hypothetical protein A2848_00125 [Candidatus Magasanikbacteria bacterium RIFCSPHIGHO2_01_FULL_50_8]OGH67901.1 MAG: hypothetical protein A3C15_01725 [Candidatus Magasanikbacteria bacterium RIFCSPHIGHO2_02_FULL_50_9b]